MSTEVGLVRKGSTETSRQRSFIRVALFSLGFFSRAWRRALTADELKGVLNKRACAFKPCAWFGSNQAREQSEDVHRRRLTSTMRPKTWLSKLLPRLRCPGTSTDFHLQPQLFGALWGYRDRAEHAPHARFRCKSRDQRAACSVQGHAIRIRVWDSNSRQLKASGFRARGSPTPSSKSTQPTAGATDTPVPGSSGKCYLCARNNL